MQPIWQKLLANCSSWLLCNGIRPGSVRAKREAANTPSNFLQKESAQLRVVGSVVLQETPAVVEHCLTCLAPLRRLLRAEPILVRTAQDTMRAALGRDARVCLADRQRKREAASKDA